MERSGLVGIVATPPGTKNKQKLGSRTGSYGQKYSSVFIYIYIYKRRWSWLGKKVLSY
jgi:hypothetical protein